MKQAVSLFEIKSFDDAKRTFEGIATTIATDRTEDIVEPKGASFKLPLDFLYQHDTTKPIGKITEAVVKNDGIHVRGHIENLPDAPPSLKERLDVAWAEMKSKLIRGLSIGFRPTENPTPIKGTFGLRYAAWEWLELSMVTIPANAEATILTVKQYNANQRAALGHSFKGVRLLTQPPGASGSIAAHRGAVILIPR